MVGSEASGLLDLRICGPSPKLGLKLFSSTARKRWDVIFSDQSLGVDLRETVKDPGTVHPCEDGLRSICWKAFLLYGPISLVSWPKKMSESRAAYDSLRGHFLKYIDHPDDLESDTDPLADDDTSPWSSLRQDEAHREEIYQDVQRCMQDNYFFREPSTQKKMLDILFIYSKLNPDTGYRQGMHELLAPILWVIECDALQETPQLGKADAADDGYRLMTAALDCEYIEHDAFSLFCAVMQTAKSFYETGENKDSSPIVARCQRIQEDLLATVDPELAHHLQVIGVLPQVYLIRWVRLLFGREFGFVDVLRVWDILFADNVSLHLVDMICIVMLLQIRWSLIDADYSTALTLLLRYSLPPTADKPESLIRDARYLNSDRSIQTGASLIKKFSGRLPKFSARALQSPPGRLSGLSTPPVRQRITHSARESASPGRSPARYLPQQKNLETLFQEVSGGIQRRTEGWNLSKAVIGAVGEVKRNVNYLQQSASNSPRASKVSLPQEEPSKDQTDAEVERLSRRVQELETRSKALAKMLDTALESLRSCRVDTALDATKGEDPFNISLAKLQFISVYMADAEIPLPGEDLQQNISVITDSSEVAPTSERNESATAEAQEQGSGASQKSGQSPSISTDEVEKQQLEGPQEAEEVTDQQAKSKKTVRPSLAESSFSFMLGENRHRSSFVSSVTDLPERRRDSESKSRPQQIWAESRDKQDRKGSESEDDHGFTLNSLQGEKK